MKLFPNFTNSACDQTAAASCDPSGLKSQPEYGDIDDCILDLEKATSSVEVEIYIYFVSDLWKYFRGASTCSTRGLQTIAILSDLQD